MKGDPIPGHAAIGRPEGCAPTRAMALAAGFGLRMRPITDHTPKPLIQVQGRALLDRALDRLAEAGIEDVVVNLHHLGPLIERHVRGRSAPRVAFTHEDTLLDTGGGVAKALPHLGAEPFFVVNGDVLWLDGPQLTLGMMAAAWDDARMDGLLLVHPTVEAYGYDGTGDFVMDPDGRLVRRPEGTVSPHLFTGVSILHPRLFTDAPEGTFSLNVPFDRAIEAGRLHGLLHDGKWFHIGTPEGLAVAEGYMREQHSGVKRT